MKIDRELGKGSFSRVFAVHNQEGIFAIKMIGMSVAPLDFQEKFLPREVQIWPALQHQNIVRMYHLYTHPLVHILQLELVEGTDLLEFMNHTNGGRGLSDRTAQLYFRQIGCALQYIHSLGVAHRDLKLENILVDSKSGVVKICDFGFCRAVNSSGDLSETFCGSKPYASPQILLAQPYSVFSADIWALGVSLLVLGFWKFSLFNSCSYSFVIMV